MPFKMSQSSFWLPSVALQELRTDIKSARWKYSRHLTCLKGLQTPVHRWLNQAHIILSEWLVWCRILKTTQWWGMMLRCWCWGRVRKVRNNSGWRSSDGGGGISQTNCWKMRWEENWRKLVLQSTGSTTFHYNRGTPALLSILQVDKELHHSHHLLLQHFKGNCSEQIVAKISLWHVIQGLDSTPVWHFKLPTKKESSVTKCS